MKLKAIIEKIEKFDKKKRFEDGGGYVLKLDFGEIYEAEATMLFRLQGTETIVNVEIEPEGEEVR